MIVRGWYRGAALALMLAGMAACTTVPEDPGAVVTPETEQILQAGLLAASGQPLAAANLFEAAANQADVVVAGRLRMRAALLYLDGNEPEAAARLLDHVRDTDTGDSETDRLARLVEAELRLADDPAESLALLDPIPAALAAQWRPRWLHNLGAAQLANELPLPAARSWHDRMALLESADARAANAEDLWRALIAIPMDRLRTLVPGAPDEFGAWLELAHAVRTERLQPDAMTANVEAWRERYPEHPAAPDYAADFLDDAIEALAPPARVALLLPLSGRLQSVGDAVRQGFLAAYYADAAGRRPELRIYDVGEEGKETLTAYRDAVENGFDLVIGPLTKPALERLTTWDDYPVPVLALNRLSDMPQRTAGLYQFGLAPEEDAAASAALAATLGFERVVSLTPRSDWGERVEAAFAEGFAARGGQVIERGDYDPDAEDFSAPIRALFNLDASAERYARLRETLRRGDIHFEPRRRTDMDAAFMGAFPREARLIKPQVRFHRGIDVPVIGTSQSYTGAADPTANQDLDETLIVDLPWITGTNMTEDLRALQATLERTWADRDPRLGRLRALGVDAYRLAGPVDVLAADAGLAVDAATGRLTVAADGIIHRALTAARFRSGRLEPADDIAGPFGNGLP